MFDHGSPPDVADALRPVLAAAVGLALPLAPLGFFLTAEAPAFSRFPVPIPARAAGAYLVELPGGRTSIPLT